MCNIFMLSPGIIPPFDKFQNCVWNNPHGYGVILRANDRLEVKKGFDPKGTDPEEIYRILTDNIDIERYVHVRWATDGTKNLDNTHPFPVYSSNKRDVYFMHNGVLGEYRPPAANSVLYEDDELRDASDSRRFAEQRLTPLLLKMKGANGSADIEDPTFQDVVEKFWQLGSKGLLIASDLKPYQINKKNWTDFTYMEKVQAKDDNTGKTVEAEVQRSFPSANNDYWAKLTRGPVFEEQEAKARAAREAEAAKNVVQGHRFGPQREVKTLTSETFRSRYEIPPSRLKNMAGLADLLDDHNVAVLSALSAGEIEQLIKEEPGNAVVLFMIMSSSLQQFYDDMKEAKDDVEQAQKTIVGLKTQLAEKEEKNGSKDKKAA